MSAWWVGHWRGSPTARAIAEREGPGLAHNGGTPRHPRTAQKAAKKWTGRHFTFTMEEDQTHLFHKLKATGYYDEYRRAFEASEE